MTKPHVIESDAPLRVELHSGPSADTPAWFAKAVATKPETFFVTVDGKRIEGLAWGPLGAPGILFLHGNMAHAHWWSFIAPFFATRFRVAALSFSGMGWSSHAPSYSIEGYADEAMAVARHAGLEREDYRFTVVGHSAGGGVAAVLAARHGDLLARAVMIDSLIAPGEPQSDEKTDRPPRVYESAAEAVSRYRLVPAQPEPDRYLLDWIASRSLIPVPDGWQWSFDPRLRGRFHARGAWKLLHEACCPLVFINGALSMVATPERVSALKAHVPTASFITVPGAHHHIPLDQPIALVAALDAILQPNARKCPQATGTRTTA